MKAAGKRREVDEIETVSVRVTIMHEASLISEVCRLVRQEAAEHGIHRVTAVHLAVGEFAGVLPDALDLAFRAACSEPPFFAGTELELNRVDAVALCDECGEHFRPRSRWLWECPRCGKPSARLISGDELLVVSFSGE